MSVIAVKIFTAMSMVFVFVKHVLVKEKKIVQQIQLMKMKNEFSRPIKEKYSNGTGGSFSASRNIYGRQIHC